jgi:quercetin dioxygenase-like cupin family protein
MKLFSIDEIKKIKNPHPGEKAYRPEVLTFSDNAKNLGGMFGLLEPDSSVPYHYHKERESILIVLSGEAVEIVEGKEYALKAGDVIFIPAGEHHGICNRNKEEVRFIEFFTSPPLSKDFILAVTKEEKK